ncbi:Transcriptional regulatory protein QseB [bioreactor metagenome]|uniref:Transcriptional regulatory protein QseB n=1 Tax=bioreactor metagenome TaxID=1076179 RepID=A0A645C477_9ZZZZ
MRLLIIEDNTELANSMKTGLEKVGFHVDVSYTGANGEERAYVNGYDAILLDLNLPDKDGIDILKFLRKSNIEIPVIIITARDEIEERALGLDLGADDYLTKPFQLLELRARVQAVIRRFHGRTNPLITLGRLIINPVARTAEIDGKDLELVPKEFDILEYVASCYPAVVSSEEIAEHVYDEEYDPFSSVLRVHLTRLRRKLSDAAGHDVLITTRGKGYSLNEKI